MACCDWIDFKRGFLAKWSESKPAPALDLIDWKKARTDWRRYHCTGAESASMQLRDLRNEGDYNRISKERRT